MRMTSTDRLALDADRERCLALLSIADRRPVPAQVLAPIETAAHHWHRGDKALANLRFVFAGLPRLNDRADADRLRLAEYLLDEGLPPRTLLGLDPGTSGFVKYNPEQPRVPAGHGRQSGQWSDGDNPVSSNDRIDLAGLTSDIVQIADDEPIKPAGQYVVPNSEIDPLDPKGLNGLLSTWEQKAITDTLNTIKYGTEQEIKKLGPHPIKIFRGSPSGC